MNDAQAKAKLDRALRRMLNAEDAKATLVAQRAFKKLYDKIHNIQPAGWKKGKTNA